MSWKMCLRPSYSSRGLANNSRVWDGGVGSRSQSPAWPGSTPTSLNDAVLHALSNKHILALTRSTSLTLCGSRAWSQRAGQLEIWSYLPAPSKSMLLLMLISHLLQLLPRCFFASSFPAQSRWQPRGFGFRHPRARSQQQRQCQQEEEERLLCSGW